MSLNKNRRGAFLRKALPIMGVLLVCVAAGAIVMRSYSGHDTPTSTTDEIVQSSTTQKIERVDANSVIVPAQLAEKIGLKTCPASYSNRPISLPSLHGVLALDNDCLSRVHSRFDGEVVEIGQERVDNESPRTLRVGDWVDRGDLLAVVWSTGLGEKKSELANALAKLHSEEAHRDRLKKLFAEGVAAGKNYREAEMAVQARLAEVANAELTLRTWRMNDEDMNLIRSEAERLAQSQIPAVELKNWARVEIRAPMSGVILEKNITVGDIIETGKDLFKICETKHLVVWAHVYEEDLQVLESLPRPIKWTVSVSSRSGDRADFPGTLDRIGAVIDQSQHTALVTGRVDNKSGDLKIGQFVTVTLNLPPRTDEIELPPTAVVEDGRQSIVFIQPTADEDRFVRQPVHVVRRTRDKIYVKLDDKLTVSGSFIVTAGAMMIQNAMDQLPITGKFTHVASHPISNTASDIEASDQVK